MIHPEHDMSPSHSLQERLIADAREGDRVAQEELWRTHRRWVAAIILAHRPSTVEVEDLMQEVAMKLVSKMSSLRDAASFRPWLRQIVLNVCRGSARSLRPTMHLNQSEFSEPELTHERCIAVPASTQATSTELVGKQDAAHRLMEQLRTLPPEYREPLLLRCVRSLTYQQISRILDLPVTTIETRLARARRMLRDEISDEIAAES